MGQPLLSLCMIVKNEERQLPSFINMHADLFDEWVIVDTGSTDRTVELLRELGIPIHQWKWTNDFSAARNHALSLCNGKWIAAFDADERIAPHDQEKLRQIMASEHCDALMTSINNYINVDTVTLSNYHPADGSYTSVFGGDQDYGYEVTELIRFFKNNRGFCWKSPIHEVLDCYDSPNKPRVQALEGIPLHHLGTLDKEGKDKGKEALYSEISKELYAEVGPQNSAKELYEAARFVENTERKLDLLEMALEKAPKDPVILKELVNTHAKNGALDLALQACEEIIQEEPDRIEGYLAKAQCLSQAERHKEAVECLKKEFRQFRSHAIYLYTLATTCLRAEEYPAAVSYSKQAYRLAPKTPFIAELHQRLNSIQEKKD